MLVQGDRIAAVGKANDVRHHASRITHHYDFPNGILLPGLVNPHTHLENTHFADSIQRRQPFADWIRQMAALVRVQGYNEAFASARDGVKLLLRAGVTCFGDSSYHGASFAALCESSLRGVVFKELICWRDEDLDERFQRLVAWLDSATANERARVGIAPHAPYTVTPNAYRRAHQFAMGRNLPLCTHVAESPDEWALIKRRQGRWALLIAGVLHDAPIGLSPIRYLDWLGVLHEGLLLVHCVQVDDDDIKLLARRKVWVVHCPRSNANLQVGIMPLTKMLSAGVRVCLATDGLASAESLSPLDEVRFAMQLGKQYPSLYPTLSPQQWLRMVTLDAAAALGLDSEIGSLEAGKRADLAVFTVSQPVDDPYEALLSEGQAATLTMVGGRIAVG